MSVYLSALGVILSIAALAWVFSVLIGKVSFVDSLWSLFFVAAAIVFVLVPEQLSARAVIVLGLVTVWALRLSIHITRRNWGEPEDHRYEKIRKNNQPGFVVKSLYIVFGLQGVLAWIIAAPLLPITQSGQPIGPIDIAALALWSLGFFFEAVGDYQLSRFKAREDSDGRVLDTGLWRYTRHPNYFGEFCIWWSFWLFAVASGGWWTVFAPLLMTFLLLRVSGVAMLEKTISDRRPEYEQYVKSTNAFFPGLPREDSASPQGNSS